MANTKFELAALGITHGADQLGDLRRAFMGTPLTRRRELPAVRPEWARPVRQLLGRVRTHSSADSAGYYYKNYWQYFDDAHRSLSELQRVLKPGGGAVLVLQTSYYKDIPVELPDLYRSMSRAMGFRTKRLVSVPVDRVMSQINTRARKHLGARRYEEVAIAIEAA